MSNDPTTNVKAVRCIALLGDSVMGVTYDTEKIKKVVEFFSKDLPLEKKPQIIQYDPITGEILS
jgi:hypothetical protein